MLGLERHFFLYKCDSILIYHVFKTCLRRLKTRLNYVSPRVCDPETTSSIWNNYQVIYKKEYPLFPKQFKQQRVPEIYFFTFLFNQIVISNRVVIYKNSESSNKIATYATTVFLQFPFRKPHYITKYVNSIGS